MRKNRLSLWVMLAGAFVTFVGSAGTLRAQNSPDRTEPSPRPRRARGRGVAESKVRCPSALGPSAGSAGVKGKHAYAT